MQLLESDWFFRMVEQQGTNPEARLVGVFTVIEQWLSAPGIKDQFAAEQTAVTNTRLKTYLLETAQAAKAVDPSMLTTQLTILLQGGIAEELRDPAVHAMKNATNAAQTVVARACAQPVKHNRLKWSAAASVMIAVFGALAWQSLPLQQPGAHSTVAMQQTPYIRMAGRMPMGVNPSEMEATLSLQEKFQRGICPAPQLMVLPQGQMTAYMNVVNFRTPDNPAADRENLHAFLVWFNQTQARDCYYAPANGHTLATWR